MKAIKSLSQSKKAVVYLATAAVMAAVLFSGVDPVAAESFLDKLYKLAMAYLGGQGLADLGKYAGDAYASGKAMVDSVDPERDTSLDDAAAVAAEVADKTEKILDEAENE
jgi:hypothetical protein